jgi:hypothetical protein
MSKRPQVVIAVSVLTLGFACDWGTRAGGLEFNHEAEHVRLLTLSSGGRLAESHPAVRKPLRARQEWRVSTQKPWAVYTDHLARSLGPHYHCGPLSEVRAICSRQLPGDLILLELAAKTATTDADIQVSLEMHPD